MKKELLMIRDNGIWNEIFDISRSIHLNLNSDRNALKYARTMQSEKYKKYKMIIEDHCMYAIMPDSVNLKPINDPSRFDKEK